MTARPRSEPPDEKDARTITLDPDLASVDAVMKALPDPDELPPRSVVRLPGTAQRRSLARTVLAAFGGRSKSIPLSFRCSALVARGYVDVGARREEDVAWGYAPGDNS